MNNRTSGTVSPERYAPHLSEFYSIVNNVSPRSTDRLDTSSATGIALNRAPYSLPLPPASVRSNLSTISDLRTLITKRDMKNTVDAMSSLLSSSQGYSTSLKEVSVHASSMAQSLETLARLKGCSDQTAERFLSASGLFYLLSNHENIMSQCLQLALGDGLLDEIDDFQIRSKTMENEFKKQCKELSMKLKLQEKHNIKLSKRRVRNLVLYKESLMNLQAQLDQLETLRHDFYQDSYDLVESTCDNILENVATVSRARVEISENIARKGWSGGGLDDLLMDAGDPFNKEDETINDNEIEQGATSSELPVNENEEQRSSSPKEINRDISKEPRTPMKTVSPPIVTKSPLDYTSQSNSPLDENDRYITEEDDAGFDNSFSLPLAGSTRSRKDENDDTQTTGNINVLEGLNTLRLNEEEENVVESRKEERTFDQSTTVSNI